MYDSRTYVILDARPKRPFDIRANRRQRHTNPVIIRQISRLLKKAGLIEVKRGTGGAHLLRDAGAISLYDVYKAVEVVGEGELFHTHENPNPDCWVGANIHQVLELILLKAQTAMETILKEISIRELT
ncbi:Rrf2 family transcriptional regulator, partial [Klebsiella pneumoniae]|nr:Rrf2 family transcriptional regulator [Klebsiella pneumoniae]